MLNTYILQVRRLLRDANGSFFPLPDPNAELTDCINDARIAVTADTGCLRQLLPAGTTGTKLVGPTKTTSAVEFYPYSSVTTVAILDVMDIYLTYNGVRNPLGYLSYSQMARTDWRRLVGYSDIPRFWSQYGQSVAIAPLPNQNYSPEWDIIPQVAPLVTDATPEPIPTSFQNSIRYYACFEAYLNLQQTAKAKEQFSLYLAQTQFASKRQFQRRLSMGAPYWN